MSQLSSQDQEFVKYYLETNASSVITMLPTVEVIESSGRRAMLDVSERIATDLAIQVARRHDGNLRLGILTLADLTDENEDITEILADDFTLFLHEEGSIELIERLRLHEVVDESRLTSTGAIGNQAARQVGQTLSVDAVLRPLLRHRHRLPWI